MARRIRIEYRGSIMSVMQLTSRILKRIGQVKVYEEPSPEGDQGSLGPGEVLTLRANLITHWRQMHSEEIVQRLDWLNQEKNGEAKEMQPESDDANVWSSNLLDLWLIKALAQEKGILIGTDERLATYDTCLDKGNWNSPIFRNNRAVLHSARRECMASLDSLRAAIYQALLRQSPVKAPFYNCALIFQHLHRNQVIREPNYLTILNEIKQMVEYAENNPNNWDSFELMPPNQTWSDEEIANAYKKIARYALGFDKKNIQLDDETKFFLSGQVYLDPGRDLIGSFGDKNNNSGYRDARTHFEEAIECARRGKYDESLMILEMAKSLDPYIALEVEKESEIIINNWRSELLKKAETLRKEKKYDKAIEVIKPWPHKALRRNEDAELIASIRRLKHTDMLREADALAKQGLKSPAKLKEAKARYFALLKEENLEDQLRLYVSKKFAEL
jgi:hypothetical protein